MTGPIDHHMAGEIERLAKKVEEMPAVFQAPRSRCACDGTGLCAFHADVANRLADVARDLRQIRDILLKDE